MMRNVVVLLATVFVAVGFAGCVTDIGSLIPEPSSDANTSLDAGFVTPDNVILYPFDLLFDWVLEMYYSYIGPDEHMSKIADNLLERTAEVEYCVKKGTDASITTSAIKALDTEVDSAIKVIPDCTEVGKSAALTSLTTSKDVLSSLATSYDMPTNVKSMLTGVMSKITDAVNSLS